MVNTMSGNFIGRPTPDLKSICGDPNAPEERITSFEAFNVKELLSLPIHSTPFA